MARGSPLTEFTTVFFLNAGRRDLWMKYHFFSNVSASGALKISSIGAALSRPSLSVLKASFSLGFGDSLC